MGETEKSGRVNLYSEAAVRVSCPEQHAVNHRQGREGRKKCWADTLPWKSNTEEGVRQKEAQGENPLDRHRTHSKSKMEAFSYLMLPFPTATAPPITI